jgi:pyruvate dehydrogenase E2 component (dihydrolipoamide acetyltransferase)
MPKPGQMTEECTLIAWHKREGDPVHRGDILFEIETDKSAMDVESFSEGVVLKIVVQEGQSVAVNSICAWVGQPGEVIPDERAIAAPEATHPEAPSVEAFPAATVPTLAGLAAAPDEAAAPDSATGDTVSARTADRVRISPRASRLAAELGIDPRDVTGTGPHGRITEQHVQSHADEQASTSRAGGDDEVQPLSRMRQIIAQRLTQSFTTTPHFAVTVAVDMTRTIALRAELRSRGESYSVTDFILASTAQTLREFPMVNSRTDGTSVWRRSRVHLGLAVSVQAGLVVPVIRDANYLTIRELHDRVAALVERARAGTLGPDDLSGGTFTISNMGMFDIDQFSAIINPGESAILAVASVTPTPVVVSDGIGIRQMLKLTLSADHRLVDGELAARFLNALRRRLEDVEAMRRDAALA